MLVIQDDVEDNGECVYPPGCVPRPHTHPTAKTADFVTVTTLDRNFLPLTFSSVVRSILCGAAVQLAVRSDMSGGGAGGAGGPSQCTGLLFPVPLSVFMSPNPPDI